MNNLKSTKCINVGCKFQLIMIHCNLIVCNVKGRGTMFEKILHIMRGFFIPLYNNKNTLLLGRWQKDDGSTLIFFPDDTLIIVLKKTSLWSGTATWRFAGAKLSIINGRTPYDGSFNLTISGRKLRLENDSGQVFELARVN